MSQDAINSADTAALSAAGADFIDDLPPEMRTAINECLARSKDGTLNVIPLAFRVPSSKQAVLDAFQIVGGVPRLAHYADKNYGRFVNGIFSKTLPLTVAGDPDAPVKFEVGWLSPNRFANMAAREPVTVSGERLPAVAGGSPDELLVIEQSKEQSA